jgi:hypothetical protein
MKLSRSLFLTAMSAIWLIACSPATQVVPSSGPHAPTSPYDVQLYSYAPKKYEIIGPVSLTITDQYKWATNGDATPAFNALILQAASMGANGLYFNQQADGVTMAVVAGYHGTFYTVPMHRDASGTPVAMGTAVWVLEAQ